MRVIAVMGVAAVLLLIGSDRCAAQLTIQQPVFGVSSTATTVSVPDRGRALLSSVGRAGDSRTQTGPFRSGSNFGQFREHSSTSVSVQIHDFEEMDRYLLSQPSRAPGAPVVSGSDDYRELLARNQRRGVPSAAAQNESPVRLRMANRVPDAVPRAPATTELAAEVRRGQADRSFESGIKAMERGAVGVARLHFRLAQKQGHPEAADRLAALEPSVPKSDRLSVAGQR